MKRTFILLATTLAIGVAAINYIGHNPSTSATKPEQENADKNAVQIPRVIPDEILTLTAASPQQWWHTTIAYQIWVRSFYDSNGDGHGDLNGVTEKIDYIKSLGINTIWLSPIFESPSYHGYDTSDYYRIEQDYGSMADFDALLAAAKQRNLRVILDLAINHVSEAHPWFIESLKKNPQYDNYFIWKESIPKNDGVAWKHAPNPNAVWHTKPERKDEFYYGAFGWTQPDLNFDHPPVKAAIKDVAKFWLDKGIDGFRLDAIRYIHESETEGQADTKATLDFWQEFTQFVKSINPRALLIGEALTDTKRIGDYYQAGEGLDQAFEFNLNLKLRSVLQAQNAYSGEDSMQRSRSIRQALWNILQERSDKPDVPFDFFVSFINNHDVDRLNTNTNAGPLRAKIAAAWMLMQPGAHYIYYGEEIGMTQAGINDDMYRRGLMQWNTTNNAGFNATNSRWLDNSEFFWWHENFSPWWSEYWSNLNNREKANVKAQQNNDNSLYHTYRALIDMTTQDEVLKAPEAMGVFKQTGMAWVQTFTRGQEQRIFILNLSADQSTTFVSPKSLRGDYYDIFSNANTTLEKSVVLQPGEFLILKATP